jgi:hypothetical protein
MQVDQSETDHELIIKMDDDGSMVDESMNNSSEENDVVEG